MQKNNTPEFIITVGASAGGLNAITEVVSQLPEQLNAAVFIVLHLSKTGLGNFLIHRLQKYTTFTCTIPENAQTIEAHHIYIAPPDQHLLVKGDQVLLGQGPAENRWRPSIDVLFRSAAASHGNHVIGIILTGYLNDGTAGMSAIKRSGGYCIVQDPNQAEYPDMPLAVLETVKVDYCVPLAQIGSTITTIIENAEPKEEVTVQSDVQKEAEIAERVVTRIDAVAQLGDKSIFACPDCGGGLWNVEGGTTKRYRCHIGHSYTEKDLLIKQHESLESTLWIALRMMEERRMLLMKLSEDEANKGLSKLGRAHLQRATDLEGHIEKLKELLFATQRD